MSGAAARTGDFKKERRIKYICKGWREEYGSRIPENSVNRGLDNL